jgi:DNA repair protein RadC
MKDTASMSRVELVAELLAATDVQNASEAIEHYATTDDANNGGFRVALVSRKLLVAREIMLRDLVSAMKTEPVLGSPSMVGDWLRLYCAGLEHEVFIVLFLDVRNHLIAVEDMFRGTLTQTMVYAREVMKAAMRHNAASVIAAHNHPSGHAEPSDGDKWLTDNLASCLAMIDVKLLDHLVVGGSTVFSFAEHGLI